MADKYINEVGLRTIKEWSVGKFTNKIETVKVNGTALTPDAQKAVNVEVPKLEVGTNSDDKVFQVGITGNDDKGIVLEHGVRGGNAVMFAYYKSALGTSDYTDTLASIEYVDEHGGKIDKIKVNGVEQTITNKEVDVEVPKVEIDTNSEDKIKETIITNSDDKGIRLFRTSWGLAYAFTDDIANDTELISTQQARLLFRTEAQVQDAIDAALADVDLSDYWTMTEGQANSLVAMTVTEINAILEA